MRTEFAIHCSTQSTRSLVGDISRVHSISVAAYSRFCIHFFFSSLFGPFTSAGGSQSIMDDVIYIADLRGEFIIRESGWNLQLMISGRLSTCSASLGDPCTPAWSSDLVLCLMLLGDDVVISSASVEHVHVNPVARAAFLFLCLKVKLMRSTGYILRMMITAYIVLLQWDAKSLHQPLHRPPFSILPPPTLIVVTYLNVPLNHLE